MDFNKELISLVSHYKPLYEMNSRRTKEELDAMWIEIAEKLNTDVVSCQTRWRTLRTAFGKHHKKQLLNSIDKSHRRPNHWCYYKPMSFLVGQIRHRSSKRKRRDRKTSNSAGAVSESSSNSDHNSEEPSPVGNSTMPIYDPVNLSADFGPNWDGAGDALSGASPDQNPKRRKIVNHTEEIAKVSNHQGWASDHNYDQAQPQAPAKATCRNNIHKATSYRKQEPDNIDHFGMFIAAQLKTKPMDVVEDYMKRICDVLFSNVLVEVTISEQQLT